MPSETGGMRNRSGGMSVSLASPDGRVVGGGVAGLLVAAGPVQVLFLLCLFPKQKKSSILPCFSTYPPLYSVVIHIFVSKSYHICP